MRFAIWHAEGDPCSKPQYVSMFGYLLCSRLLPRVYFVLGEIG